ncbi:MAG: hypothetical protein R3A12_15255 [Ignavibacteria bacterium]
MLLENKEDLSYLEKFNLIAILKNYAYRKLNEGDKDFKASFVEVCKFSIDKDILSYTEKGGYINEMRFMNLVWTGTISNELDWLEEFIKNFIKELSRIKNNMYLLTAKQYWNLKEEIFHRRLNCSVKADRLKMFFIKLQSNSLL